MLGADKDIVIGSSFLILENEEEKPPVIKPKFNAEEAFMFFMEHCNDKPKIISGLAIGRALGLDVFQSNKLIGDYWDKKEKEECEEIMRKSIESYESKKLSAKCTECGKPILATNDPQVCVDCYM